MGSYGEAAAYYDLLYAFKDYQAEATAIAELIRDRGALGKRVLDVACGTGEHARHLTALGFHVDGIDIEPAFVDRAASKNPSGTFRTGDMADFDIEDRYDAVVCLFSAIGYVQTVDRLNSAVRCMAAHLCPGGVAVVEPWFGPGDLTDGWINMTTGENEEIKVARLSRTVLAGSTSRLEFEYLIGRASGLERRSETHELGLFRQEEMTEAFQKAGLAVEHIPGSLRNRGLYVGRAEA